MRGNELVMLLLLADEVSVDAQLKKSKSSPKENEVGVVEESLLFMNSN